MIKIRQFTKDERMIIAQKLWNYIVDKYAWDIDFGIQNSHISFGYSDVKSDLNYMQRIDVPRDFDTEIIVLDTDSVDCLMHLNIYESGKFGVLNFASYKHPGGMFLNGSTAQEEFLCYHSILYPILRDFIDMYYVPHRKKLNNGLYGNDLIYCDRILFIDHSLKIIGDGSNNNIDCEYRTNSTRLSSVITCAAPNARSYLRRKYGEWYYEKPDVYKDEELYRALYSRIVTILSTAVRNEIKTLILGAFGCGVFGNDPAIVADIFYKLLTNEFKGFFKRVYFPIPRFGNEHDKNYDAFSEVGNQYGVKTYRYKEDFLGIPEYISFEPYDD